MSDTRTGTTLHEANAWLDEYDTMLTEWRELNSIPAHKLKPSTFKRFNTLSTILVMREASAIDVLRAVCLTELGEVRV